MPTYQNIVAIWKRKDKNGNTYLSMKVERDLKAGESINIFANDKKGVENRPDFRAYEKIEDEDEQAPSAAPAQYDDERDPFTGKTESEQIAEDIPF